ncbi:hypothetical protein PybrP1_006260 [[Pythium] brassicae (nom. inval.)]|nr:hypothetical protein PybrP1_006260 [[Pythium] brassicae (nom. inval.)]
MYYCAVHRLAPHFGVCPGPALLWATTSGVGQICGGKELNCDHTETERNNQSTQSIEQTDTPPICPFVCPSRPSTPTVLLHTRAHDTKSNDSAAAHSRTCALPPTRPLLLFRLAGTMATSPSIATTTATTAIASVASTATCRYAGKKCANERAVKRNGALHNLCHYHRVRANQNQRRMELRRRVKRSREDREAATMAVGVLLPPAYAGVRGVGCASPVDGYSALLRGTLLRRSRGPRRRAAAGAIAAFAFAVALAIAFVTRPPERTLLGGGAGA